MDTKRIKAVFLRLIQAPMYLVIDVGNTKIKTAIFESDDIKNFDSVKTKDLETHLTHIFAQYSIKSAIVSAVGSWNRDWEYLIEKNCPLLYLNHQTPLAFKNNYETPESLGVDRIALAAAAHGNFEGQNCLVIDAGTCITYDFINKQAAYLGGAIAPGIRSRYKALHDYTANLPLLETKKPDSFIGKNTIESIHSGVINGILKEIAGIIHQYDNEFGKLTVVLTGGDADYLAKQIKSSIFVRPYFLMEGLYYILKQNTDE